MEPITCSCGATYTPKDKNAVTRHEATKKHKDAAAETEAGWDLDMTAPDPVAEQSSDDWPETFDDLDKIDAAKAFTEDERLSIFNSIAATKSARDLTITPKVVAESYVAAVIDATPDINEKVLPDLQTYAQAVVHVLRAEGVEPIEESFVDQVEKATNEDIKTKRVQRKPTKTAKTAVASTQKRQKTERAKGRALSGHSSPDGEAKECRVCHKVKPLSEYRVKSSRPDGRDTICAECSKAWLVNHKAKKAAQA